MSDIENTRENSSTDDAELLDTDVYLEETSLSIGLNISTGKHDELHVLNDPSAPFQRSTISERHGIILVQCLSREVIHGYLTPDGESATLLVYDLHLDTTKKSRRIRKATITFEFKSSVVRRPAPEVVKIAPFLRKHTLLTSADESKTREYGLSAGVSQFVNLETSANWETTVSKTNTDTATVTGYILGDNYGKPVAAKWELFENELAQSGTPSFMRCAILLNRGDGDENFECKVTIKVKADWKTGMGELLGFTPPDDPVLFNTAHPPTNKFRKVYDIENLDAIELSDFEGISFGETFKEGFKEGSA